MRDARRTHLWSAGRFGRLPVITVLGVWLAGLSPLLSEAITEQGAKSSDFWGTAGERWTPQSRLPDLSFAGYRAGETPIPDVPVKASVKDFGAKGDGRTHDTAAFQRTMASVTNGAITIPAGRYRISDALVIQKSGVVLRGTGEGKTALCFERSFEIILGADKVPYWGGLLEVRGQQKGEKLTTVRAAAKRGDTRLQLASAAGISQGQWVRLRMRNPPDNTLGACLYADKSALNAERRRWYDGHIIDWAVRVAAVSGNMVTLARPLRVDVRPEWQPAIWQHHPTVQGVGIEDPTIEFPNVQYRGHWKEEGWFAIQLLQVFNCWVRRATIVDADIACVIKAGGHNTASQVTLKAHWRTGADTQGETGNRIVNNVFLDAVRSFLVWPTKSLPRTLDYSLYYSTSAPPRWQRDGVVHQTFRAYQQAAGETHSRYVDPRLVGPADARLRPGSPAIDAGATVSEVPTDLDRLAGPQGAGHDIGAFEAKPAPIP